MRAMRQHGYGRPLMLEEVPAPEPAPDEVLVRLTYAAANPIDVWIAAGTVTTAGPLPRTAGSEGVGVTADGRRVAVRGAGLGLTRDGTYADLVAVPEAAVTELPPEVADQAAAGLGIVGVTALDALELGGVGADTTVLLLGGSGAVASLAAQLAQRWGARVIVQTHAPERADLVRPHADEVVVADADTLVDAVLAVAPDGVDVVLDGLAGAYTQGAVDALVPGGRLVLYGASSGAPIELAAPRLYRKGASVLGYGGLAIPPERLAASLRRLLDEVAAGRLLPRVAGVLPLEEADEAHRRIREGRAGGKLLLRI